MHVRGKSDRPVVPANPPNKTSVAEVGEERGRAKGNTASKTHPGLSAGQGASSALERVREVARRDKDARFTALLHHVTPWRLDKAYRAVRPKAAPGVDGVSWAEYGQNLQANLRDLHERVQSGRYRAKPSKRAYIGKEDGRQRPPRDRRAGGQDRPAGAGRGAQRRLRGGFPGFLLWVSATAWSA
jgi:hypothetical protein